MSLHQSLNCHRIAHAQWMLSTTDHKVIEIALDAGFGSVSRFYANFKSACGISPSQYRARGR
jgi:AraC-like DNA-binding protein